MRIPKRLAILLAGTTLFSAAGCAESHDLIFIEGKAPTCTESGTAGVWQCRDCGERFSDRYGSPFSGEVVLSALGHLPSEKTVSKPVCGVDGRMQTVCLRCGEVLGERALAAPNGHVWQDNVCLLCDFRCIPTEGLSYTRVGERGSPGVSVGLGTATSDKLVVPNSYLLLPVVALEPMQGAALTEAEIYADLSRLAPGTFATCERLKKVLLPPALREIGEDAFSRCISLTEISLPESVAEIGARAFYSCVSAKSLTLGATVRTIGSSAFWRCSALETVSVAEENPVFSGEGNCLIERSSGKLLLGSGGCSRVPDSVTEIADYAFFANQTLTRLRIPRGVKKIGVSAFEECPRLEEIFFEGDEAEWNAIQKGARWNAYLPSGFHVVFGAE